MVNGDIIDDDNVVVHDDNNSDKSIGTRFERVKII